MFSTCATLYMWGVNNLTQEKDRDSGKFGEDNDVSNHQLGHLCTSKGAKKQQIKISPFLKVSALSSCGMQSNRRFSKLQLIG